MSICEEKIIATENVFSIVKILHFIEKLNMFELCEKWKENDFEENLHVFWLSIFKICVQKIIKKSKIKIWKTDLVKINKKMKNEKIEKRLSENLLCQSVLWTDIDFEIFF